MTLHTRFFLLIIGIVAVPPLVLGLALFINSLTWTDPVGVKGIMASQGLFRELRRGELTVQDVAEHLEPSQFGLPIYVLDRDGRLLLPADRAGEPAAVEDILHDLRASGPQSATILSVADEDGGSGYIIGSYPIRNFSEQIRNIGIVVPLSFVLFVSIMSVLIIRSINRSIIRLEGATRRIANGDLDFELSTSGKDRIAALTRSFETMRRQLKEQSDRGARFIMGLSHDLKTPLSSITGYVDAIRDGYADSPEKLEQYTAIIQTKTQLLESRISALIDYAKQETREWHASLKPAPLRPFLEEFVSLVETEALARKFGFRGSVQVEDELTARMDPDMVLRALDNLAENAFLYADAGSEIRVTAVQTAPALSSGQPGAVVVTIQNEGPGISAELLPLVFDPLVRGDNARAGRGSGLGLSVVKSVVNSHGWEIGVESEPGGWTAFRVTIPVDPGGSVSG